jgi:hypothetical protein
MPGLEVIKLADALETTMASLMEELESSEASAARASPWALWRQPRGGISPPKILTRVEKGKVGDSEFLDPHTST